MNGFRIKSFEEYTQSIIEKIADKKNSALPIIVSVMDVIDTDNEMITTGAYEKTIRERGPESARPRIKHLWQHKTFDPIGTPLELIEQDVDIPELGKRKGLFALTKFDNSTFSQDKFQQHLDGTITEFSIGFEVMNWEKAEDTIEGKVIEYTKLTEIKLWEYSSVTWGANQYTQILKSLKDGEEQAIIDLEKRIEILRSAMKSSRYNDMDKDMFELELLQIKEMSISLAGRSPGGICRDDPPGGNQSLQAAEALSMIKSFRKQLNF